MSLYTSPPGLYLSAGTRLNNMYEVERVVGEGGMGVVYKGRAIETGDPVAIKVIRNEAALALFRKEASVLNNLVHEAIVRYYGFPRDPDIDRPYLATEFVDGVSLADVAERKALPRAEVITLAVRLAEGLQAAHRLGVVHRDISPDNVILPGGDVARAKIIDFGIARAANFGGATLIGDSIAGKFDYMSPEQLGLAGGNVTPRSDMYSLGIVLAEAALGRSLNMGGMQAQVIEKRRSVPKAIDEIEPRLRGLLSRMLQPNPVDRPETMTEIAQTARSIAGPAPKGQRRGPMIVSAVAVIILAVGVGLYGVDIIRELARPEGPAAPAAPEAGNAGTLVRAPDAAPETSETDDPAATAPAAPVPDEGGTVEASAPEEPAAPEMTVAEMVDRLGGNQIAQDTPREGPAEELVATAPEPAADEPAVALADPAPEPAAGGAPTLGQADAGDTAPPPADTQPAPAASDVPTGATTGATAGPAPSQAPAPTETPAAAAAPEPQDAAPSATQAQAATARADPPEETVVARADPSPPTSAAEPSAGGGRPIIAAPDPSPEEVPPLVSEPVSPTSGPEAREPAGETTVAGLPATPGVIRPLDQSTAGVGRYIAQYDAGNCTYIRPTALSAGAATIEAYGDQVPPFVQFDENFRRSLGFEADIGLRLVKATQCPAVEFVRQLKNAGAVPLPMRLDNDTIRSGFALTGTIEGVGNRDVQVVVVNEEGRVYPIDAISQRSGDQATLHTRISGGPQSLQPHLLLVLAASPMPDAASAQQRMAPEFFSALSRELAGREGEVKAQLGYFKFGG